MIVVIGGGPAGYFSAIRARELAPDRPVVLLEKGGTVLRKVVVSGGGRCNVTHACFEPSELVARYPRGGRELRGPLHTFGPAETVAWFAERDVELKTEADGRMFPVTDSSRTIVDCLGEAARSAGVAVRKGLSVTAIEPTSSGFDLRLNDDSILAAEAVLIAAGGQTSGGGGAGYELAASLGHTIVPPVSSLYTFKIIDPILHDLAGVVAQRANIKVLGAKKLNETGPILITHWGLSGPAVLRLSAWGARHFYEVDYKCQVVVNWCPEFTLTQIDDLLVNATRNHGKQRVRNACPLAMPKRLWQALVAGSAIGAETRWAEVNKKQRSLLARRVGECVFEVDGKTTNKEEFVTCGGVALKEIDFKTMGSRLCEGLFFAGEVLDIDGITGGYNFQSCWTTGWIAGEGLAKFTRGTG